MTASGYLLLVGPETVKGHQFGVTPAMPNTNWSMAGDHYEEEEDIDAALDLGDLPMESARRISRTASKVDSGRLAGSATGRGLRIEYVHRVNHALLIPGDSVEAEGIGGFAEHVLDGFPVGVLGVSGMASVSWRRKRG